MYVLHYASFVENTTYLLKNKVFMQNTWPYPGCNSTTNSQHWDVQLFYGFGNNKIDVCSTVNEKHSVIYQYNSSHQWIIIDGILQEDDGVFKKTKNDHPNTTNLPIYAAPSFYLHGISSCIISNLYIESSNVEPIGNVGTSAPSSPTSNPTTSQPTTADPTLSPTSNPTAAPIVATTTSSPLTPIRNVGTFSPTTRNPTTQNSTTMAEPTTLASMSPTKTQSNDTLDDTSGTQSFPTTTVQITVILEGNITHTNTTLEIAKLKSIIDKLYVDTAYDLEFEIIETDEGIEVQISMQLYAAKVNERELMDDLMDEYGESNVDMIVSDTNHSLESKESFDPGFTWTIIAAIVCVCIGVGVCIIIMRKKTKLLATNSKMENAIGQSADKLEMIGINSFSSVQIAQNHDDEFEEMYNNENSIDKLAITPSDAVNNGIDDSDDNEEMYDNADNVEVTEGASGTIGGNRKTKYI